ncbi:MAG: tetratricopeptide repeat protein [Xanthobacteraceae bacterium]|nr:tetratricopeptide repeat protein [Xanthobacteraceae bacterium]
MIPRVTPGISRRLTPRCGSARKTAKPPPRSRSNRYPDRSRTWYVVILVPCRESKLQSSQIFAQALAAFQSGRFSEAEREFKKFLRGEPRHFGALNLYAALLIQTERFDEAEPLLRKAIAVSSSSDKTFYNYGLVLKKLRKFEPALEAFSKAGAINPASPETWNNRGTVLNDLSRYDEAMANFDRAVSLAPNYAEALCNKARSLFSAGRVSEAIAAYGDAIRLKPALAEAWVGRGNAYFDQRDYPDALGNFEQALILKPDNVEAFVGRGFTFLSLKRYQDADAAFEGALKINRAHDTALVGRGQLQLALGRYDEALEAFTTAIKLNPDSAEAWMYFGQFYMQLHRYNEALPLFQKALKLKGDLAGAWLGLGNFYGAAAKWDAAFDAYENAIKIKPNLEYVPGSRVHAAAQICRWDQIAADWARCIEGVGAGLPVIDPAKLFSTPATAAEQLVCALNYSQHFYPQKETPLWQGEARTHDRLNIAYVSGDFRDHPVSMLLAAVLETHDRSKFRISGISLSPESPTPMGQRMKAAFDDFHDVSKKNDTEIAELLLSLQIDVVIDLVGHTHLERPGIFAHRPAPVQVNYLGYAGTVGTPYHDYILADRVVIPEVDHDHYSERTAYLPDSFLPADDTRAVSDMPMRRADFGLPDDGVVFCSFNNAYKITPLVFDVWMRLLKKVDGSVLWLSSLNGTAQANLRHEAEARGVSPDRLIFAQRMDKPEDHLARHRLADLFLDTIYYNAHTTASDALWAGLPLITCIGSTFAGRVAASLLNTAGLPELVTTSLEDYEALALKLAGDPALLASIKAKLAANNRPASPLFNTARYTRHLEAAYTTMWRRAQNGEAPTSFTVDPLP